MTGSSTTPPNDVPLRRSVRDARGNVVTALDPYELSLLRRYDVIPVDSLVPIAKEVGFGLPKWHWRGYVACVAVFCACIVFLVIWKIARGRGIDAVERVLWPVNLAVFFLGAVQFWRSGRRARQRQIGEVMLRYLRCPHCGYDLRGLPRSSDDGATVCPECGSAWRIDMEPHE